MSQHPYASLPAINTPSHFQPSSASSTAVYIRRNKCCVKAASAVVLFVFLVGAVLFAVGVYDVVNGGCANADSGCGNNLLEIGAGLATMAICSCISGRLAVHAGRQETQPRDLRLACPLPDPQGLECG